MNEKVRIGIDVGSTTAKIVVLSEDNSVIYSEYTRHNADVKNTILGFFTRLRGRLADAAAAIKFTGSAGMGVSDRYGFPFSQEVLALNCFARRECSGLRTIIDIGGEDAKIVFLDDEALPDMRMNGNCAGGTGAFIDQMAAILGMTIAEMDAAALTQQLLSSLLELRLNHATREELYLLCRTILRGAATKQGIDYLDRNR